MHNTHKLRRTNTNIDNWRQHLQDAWAEEGGAGSLAHEVEVFLLMEGYNDFDNVTWDKEIERIYHEVKGDN